MVSLFNEDDTEYIDAVATIVTKEGLFNPKLKHIEVYTKEADEFFKQILGVFYVRYRVNAIVNSREVQ